jgi:FkbM family methyltransferase
MLHIRTQDKLAVIARYIPEHPIILEAGAFHGQDSIRMAQHWPQAIIYAFEPVPELFSKLENATAAYRHINPVPLALGATEGTHTFWPCEHPKRPGKHSQAGSLLEPQERLQWSPITFNEPITVPTTTIDAWAQQNNIDHIDLLWLDLQGYELPVMQASPHILQTVRAIWTEVHFVQAYKDQAQYPKVTAWLESQGFTLVGADFTDTTSWFFGTALFVRSPKA